MQRNYYIFRHGATFVTKGHLNTYGFKVYSAHILDEGKPIIKKLGSYLMQIPTDFNASSQFRRCRETVAIVSDITGKNFIFDKRLNENVFEPPWFVRRRVRSFLDMIDKSDHKNILICTHGAIITEIINQLTGKLMNYPDPGVLIAIQNKKVEFIDFNVSSTNDPTPKTV